MASTSTKPAPATTATVTAAQENEDRYNAAMNIQLQILSEMRQINERSRKIYAQPPIKSEKLWNFLLQFLGLLVALAFGVFAVLAWRSAEEANQAANYASDLAVSANSIAVSANAIASSGNEVARAARADATVANMLAIVARCEASPTGAMDDNCPAVLSKVSSGVELSVIANVYFGLSFPEERPTSTRSPSPTLSAEPEDTPSSPRGGVLAGSIVGSIAGFALLCGAAYLPYQTYQAQVRRARELNEALAKAEKI